jgi:hypothetical protein
MFVMYQKEKKSPHFLFAHYAGVKEVIESSFFEKIFYRFQ